MKKQSVTFLKTVLSALFFMLLLAVASCQKASETSVEMADMQAEATPPPLPERPEEAAAGGSPNDYSQTQYQQKIIRNANVRFQVADYRESLQMVENILPQFQAFIVSSNENRYDNSLQGYLVIKVPAKNLENLLHQLTKQSISLDYKNITSEDVTAEFVDISARLKAKQAVEQRYLDLLKQAKTIKDILEIENQLRVIREEIEGVQARINYINEQSALSTITLNMYEKNAGTLSGDSFGIRILNALKTGWDLLLSFFIGLLHIWPFLLLLPLLIFLFRKFIRRYPPVR